MRIFVVGDWISGTGPSNVTKYYIEYLPQGTLYQKMKGKLARVPELIVKIIRADVIVFSGYSKQNVLGMELAKLFGRPTAYIMHGCVEYENEINLEPDDRMNRVERKTLELADRVYAVSSIFAEWLREYYPEYADKIDYITNGVDIELKEKLGDYKDKLCDEHLVVSIGGGMRRKQIRYICEAIEMLRRDFDDKLRLIVVGDKGADTNIINSYSFVENRGIVSFDEVTTLLRKAKVFVQNSCFETFGLAPIEAALCGCHVLLSRHVGALSLFEDLPPGNIINDYSDAKEIADKLKGLLELEGGDKKYIDNLDWERYSWKNRSIELIEKLEKL